MKVSLVLKTTLFVTFSSFRTRASSTLKRCTRFQNRPCCGGKLSRFVVVLGKYDPSGDCQTLEGMETQDHGGYCFCFRCRHVPAGDPISTTLLAQPGTCATCAPCDVRMLTRLGKRSRARCWEECGGQDEEDSGQVEA